MYEHYKGYCATHNLPPVNSATFGKLLRNVFPDLKTRRLGVRGQSKYHYCGIRVRNETDQPSINETVRLADDITTTEGTTTTSTVTASSIPTNPGELPSFMVPSIPAFRLNDEVNTTIIANFTASYERHCKDILYCISSNQVMKIRDLLKTFYTEMPIDYAQLLHILPEMTEAIWRWDCTLYDVSIISTLFISTLITNSRQ